MKKIQVLKGGKGDKIDSKTLDQKELEVGKTVESEHTSNSEEAKEIATDHVSEDPKYYKKLIKADLVDEPKALKKARELKVESIYKSIKYQLIEQKIINEDLTRSDIELIKRLILSAFEGWLQNLFTRRSLTLTGINWRESRDKCGNIIKEARPTGLKDIEDASHLGGAFEKALGKTPEGKRRLLKPHYEPFRAHADYAASKIGKHVNPETPDVDVVDYKGQETSEQDFIDSDPFVPDDPSKLSSQEINAIIQDSVLNWMIGNHDAHRRQFIKTKTGNVIGIDKTQAFKHYPEDKLDINYHPNQKFDEDKPYIYYILEAWRDGKIDLDVKQFTQAIRKIQAIPDEQIIEWITPYAQGRAKAFFNNNPKEIQKILDIAINRKHNLFKDYMEFLSNLMKKEVRLESTDNTVDGLSWHHGEISFSVLSNGKVLWKYNKGSDLMLDDNWLGDVISYDKQKRYYNVNFLKYNSHNVMKSTANDMNYKIPKTKRVLDGRYWYEKDYDIVAFRGQRDNVFKYHHIWFNFIKNYKDHDQIYLDIPKSGKPMLMTWDQLSQPQSTQQDIDNPEKYLDSVRTRLLQQAGIHEED